MKQPKVIFFEDVKYRRIARYKALGNGISEGPFYKRTGVNARYWVFTPNLAFLNGISETPMAMHKIQRTKVALVDQTPKAKAKAKKSIKDNT